MLPHPPKIALIVHAFYAEEFAEILQTSAASADIIKLFVTTPPDKEVAIRNALKSFQGDFAVMITENRGRDVLPFFAIFRDVQREGFDLVVKVHTKRSLHRKNGGMWRREMVDALLTRDALTRAQVAFINDPLLGFVGPKRQFVRIFDFIGSNAAGVAQIAKSLGLSDAQVMDSGFFAGTMFAARVSALEPIIELGVTRADFPLESGQLDGTLAHILERCMTFGAIAKGMRIATTENLDGPATAGRTFDYANSRGDSRLRELGRKFERSVRLWFRGRRRPSG